MKASEQSYFNTLCARYLNLLKYRGLSNSALAGYSRPIRRISTHQLGLLQLTLVGRISLAR
ncbi:MAG: hypothetical protein ACJAYB_000535 [Psychromonas sp.]|jgi:hypothetical protein